MFTRELAVKRSGYISIAYQLEGYIAKKPCSQHGGFVLYLNNKYNYKNITLGEESQIWEKQFLEITRRNYTYKLILGNIYRPPCELNDNYALFNNELNLVLSQLNNLNCEVMAGSTIMCTITLALL